LKVAWVVRPAAGGMLQHMRHLLTGLSAHYDITIYGPAELEDWAGNFKFHPLNIADGIHLRQDLHTIWSLSRCLHADKPQLVHIHGLKAVVIAVPAAKMSHTPKLLFTAHNCLPKPHSRWQQAAYGVMQRHFLRSLDRVIAVSDAVSKELLPIVGYERIVTIRNGVDYQIFSGYSPTEARAELELHSEHFVVGVIARLIPEKGIECLLKAAGLLKNIMPNIRFIIVGDGPMRAQLQHYCRALHLEPYVRFLGFRQDVPKLMAGWDVFVLPSLSEGLSISVLEAMAAKLPVVVSDLPSMREIVVHGKSGFLFPPNDAPNLAAAIIKIAKDSRKARSMGEYNYQRVAQFFGIDKMIEATRLQYQDLLGKGKVR